MRVWCPNVLMNWFLEADAGLVPHCEPEAGQERDEGREADAEGKIRLATPSRLPLCFSTHWKIDARSHCEASCHGLHQIVYAEQCVQRWPWAVLDAQIECPRYCFDGDPS
jgi:hypothetical protein